jgi:riboflavin kinase/FMN adenylyltransferase
VDFSQKNFTVPDLIKEELLRVNSKRQSAIAIGVFDGVHLGHQQLFRRLREITEEESLESGLITFHPHPRNVITRSDRVVYLTGFEQRLRLLNAQNLDFLRRVTFTSELSKLDPVEFSSILIDKLNLSILVVGPDFAFGRDRKGGIAQLREIGAELGFRVEVVGPFQTEGIIISSSEIRARLESGEIQQANQMLGRRFSLEGPVVEGFRRGITIGFPTANISVGKDRVIPKSGVYATYAFLNGRKLKSVSNIGIRPTFEDNNNTTVECHIFDFNSNLYGKNIQIELAERLRGERKFGDVEELKKQISQDSQDARKSLAK